MTASANPPENPNSGDQQRATGGGQNPREHTPQAPPPGPYPQQGPPPGYQPHQAPPLGYYAQQGPPPGYYPPYPPPPHATVQTTTGGTSFSGHGFHAILTVFTCGLWAPVWIIWAISSRQRTTTTHSRY